MYWPEIFLGPGNTERAPHTGTDTPHTSCRACQKTWSVQCRPGRYGKESRLLLVAFPSPSPIGGERSDVSTLYSYVVWRHAGTAAGHTPYTQTRTGPAGRSSVLSRSIAVTGSWDSVCWCDRVKMAQQCVVICSWFWLYTDCWCG
jgi:hypothetical protein